MGDAQQLRDENESLLNEVQELLEVWCFFFVLDPVFPSVCR